MGGLPRRSLALKFEIRNAKLETNSKSEYGPLKVAGLFAPFARTAGMETRDTAGWKSVLRRYIQDALLITPTQLLRWNNLSISAFW